MVSTGMGNRMITAVSWEAGVTLAMRHRHSSVYIGLSTGSTANDKKVKVHKGKGAYI